MRLRRLYPLSMAVGLMGMAIQSATAAPTPPNLSNSEFQQCLSNLKNSSAFRGVASTFEQYRPSEPDPSVIVSLNYQPEFQKETWDYLASLVDAERVQDGIAAKNQYQSVLDRIEQHYGVKGTDVLGVWGVESNFGKQLGKKDLIQSLATLSCFDRRQSYFRSEYANALKIIQNGDVRRDDMTGSWAGAFGQTQFMPSTFLRLAQDFDGDGRKDLVNSQADALASTANFLDKAGYRSGEPWGFEVSVPSGYWAASNRKDKKPMSYWRDKGFTLANGQPLPSSLDSAGLLLPAGQNGPAFLVGKNFEAFYSYNASENYALAIAHLSDLISQNNTNVNFVKAWPTDDPGISRRQTREIQQALLNRGYDIGTADGMIGEKSRQAIQDFQRQQGVNPDGRAGLKLYNLLVAGGARQASIVPNFPSSGVQDRMGQYIQRSTQTAPSGSRTTIHRTDNGTGTAVIVSP